MKLPLYASKSYWEATEEKKAEVCNGCGAKGGVKFPSTMWCLNIKEACNIHDWMFHIGRTYGDMVFSNAMFMYNLSAIIVNNSNWFTVMPRLSRAVKYYLGVVKKGESAYWVESKEKNTYKNITIIGEFK